MRPSLFAPKPVPPKPVAETISHYIRRLEALSQKDPNWIRRLIAKFGATLNVVSIGFGEYPIELDALTEFLKPYHVSYRYFGCDIDQAAVTKCQAAYPKAQYPHISFNQIDGTNYLAIKQVLDSLRLPVHLVILRHPVLNSGRRDIAQSFHTIFTQTVPYILAEGGSLLVSIFTEHELLPCRSLLSALSPSYRELPEDEPQSRVLWEAEYTTAVSAGICSGVATPLYAERFFFAITDFKRPFFLQLEYRQLAQPGGVLTESPINPGLAGSWQICINQPPHRTWLPVYMQERLHYILTCIEAVFCACDQININTLLAAITGKLRAWESRPPKQVTDPRPYDYFVWKYFNFPQEQIVLIQRLLQAISLLQEVLPLETSVRQANLSNALKLLALRPVSADQQSTDSKDRPAYLPLPF